MTVVTDLTLVVTVLLLVILGPASVAFPAHEVDVGLDGARGIDVHGHRVAGWGMRGRRRGRREGSLYACPSFFALTLADTAVQREG